jgi:preprotein translocase SecE subunit
MKRVVWPDRKKLIQSTATVLAICLIIGIALFIIDSVLGGILNSVGFYSQTPTTNTTTQTTVAPTDATTTTAESSETTAD